MSDDNTYYETNAKIDRIIDKQFLKTEGPITVGNYEIVLEPEYHYNKENVRKLSYYKTIFRKKTNHRCYIDFKLEIGIGKNNYMLHIDIFSCTVKGSGLEMLVALVRYISGKALENGLNNNNSTIQLSAEPITNRGGLEKLVLYYIRIGFNTENPLPREMAIKYFNEEELNEEEDTQINDFYMDMEGKESVRMEANLNVFLDLHRDLLVGGKKKRKTKKLKIKRRKTNRI
jgi:hypothetical protein